MRLSQTATHAVHAALRLAQADSRDPVPCAKLAREGQMPERFLLQILRDMAKHGLLRATRGGGGGFRLLREPEQISLLEVIEAVDGPLSSGLPGNSNFPPAWAAALQRALSDVACTIRRQLATIKLSDLLAAPTTIGQITPQPGAAAPQMGEPIFMAAQVQSLIDA